MTPKGTLYGVAATAAIFILISTSFGAYYFSQYSRESSDSSQLAQELNAANSTYSQLATNYNALIAKYNTSISLLSAALAEMNTSEPAYQQASRELGSLWQAYLGLKPAATSLLSDSLVFEYGNGTKTWYNDTDIDAGWNLYIETVILMKGQVSAQWYPQYGEHLISGIGGVNETQTSFWFLWVYDRASSSWQQASTGADEVRASSGAVYAWTFCGADQSFNPTCHP